MLSLTLTFLTSLLLGMRHATDPDHVVAVTTIVSRERSLGRAARIGALWGVGHTMTILAVGGAIILLKLAFTPRLGLSLEFAVACMLVVLGTLNLFDVRPRAGGWTSMRPLLVGIVHGLAGSAAATLLIVPLIDDVRWAMLFLVVFGIGTVVGMSLVTLGIAVPAAFAATRFTHLQRGLRMASGAISLAFGVYLAHRVGIVEGLFTAQPVWEPR
jgi:high-affinity nickel-transport protein